MSAKPLQYSGNIITVYNRADSIITKAKLIEVAVSHQRHSDNTLRIAHSLCSKEQQVYVYDVFSCKSFYHGI